MDSDSHGLSLSAGSTEQHHSPTESTGKWLSAKGILADQIRYYDSYLNYDCSLNLRRP